MYSLEEFSELVGIGLDDYLHLVLLGLEWLYQQQEKGV